MFRLSTKYMYIIHTYRLGVYKRKILRKKKDNTLSAKKKSKIQEKKKENKISIKKKVLKIFLFFFYKFPS